MTAEEIEAWDITDEDDDPDQTRLGSQPGPSPRPPQTWREKMIENVFYKYAGIKLMATAQIFGAIMAATTRVLEASTDPPYNPFQILFARMSITYVLCIGYMWWRKTPDMFLGPPGVRGLLCLRGTFGFLNTLCWYYSLAHLELSDSVTLGFLSPTVTGLLAWMLLSERFERFEALGGFISLFGVVFIAKPSFLIGGGGDTASAIERTKGVIAGLANTVGSSLVYVTIRTIGKRAHPLMCNSFFAMWCVIGSVAAVIFIPDVHFIIPQSALEWALLSLLGVAGFIFQYLMTAAVQSEKTSIVAAMTYTMLLWSLMLQWIIWNTTPDIWSWLGITLIVGSAIYIALRRIRATKGRGDNDEAKPPAQDPEAEPLNATDSETDSIAELQELRGDGSVKSRT